MGKEITLGIQRIPDPLRSVVLPIQRRFAIVVPSRHRFNIHVPLSSEFLRPSCSEVVFLGHRPV